MFDYDVSGMHVLTQWFSYRKKNGRRPIMGDRRPPSTLAGIRPDHWLAGHTSCGKNDRDGFVGHVPCGEVAAGLEPVQICRWESRFGTRRLAGQAKPILPAPSDHDATGGLRGWPGLLGASGKIVDQRVEGCRGAESR